MMFDWEKRKQEILYLWNESGVVEFGDKMVKSEKAMLEPLVNCLKLYYDHCKNNHQINGINETAKKLLEGHDV